MSCEIVLARADDSNRGIALGEFVLLGNRAHQQHASRRRRHAVERRVCRRSRVRQLAAFAAAAGAELDDVIGARDHRRIVLDDDHRVAEIAQAAQHREQSARVGRVQADGRLVERVERPDQHAAERAREMNPLRLAARQRARLPFERQVAEADFEQIADAIAQLAHHDRRARRDLGIDPILSSHVTRSRIESRPTSAIDCRPRAR